MTAYRNLDGTWRVVSDAGDILVDGLAHEEDAWVWIDHECGYLRPWPA